MCFFSILIPSYNSKMFIEQCVRSIVAQDFNDYEIIICDQGDTDSSFLKKIFLNAPIIIIRKEKPSAYQARAELIKHCQGKYFLFLDADDRHVDNSLKILKESIIKTGQKDLYYFGYILSSANFDNHLSVPLCLPINKDDYMNEFLSSSKQNFITTKCYKNKKSYSFFDVGYNKSSDRLLNINLLPTINSIVCLKFNPYIYTVNNQSITNNPKIDYINQHAFCSYQALKLCYTEEQRKYNILSSLENAADISIRLIRRKLFFGKKTFLSFYKFNYFEELFNIAINCRGLLKGTKLKKRIKCFAIMKKYFLILKIISHIKK